MLIFNLITQGCGIKMDYSIKEKDKRIQDYVTNRISSGDFPGLQYVITSPDSIIFNLNAGVSDINSQKPMESKTTMMIYSMTKTFTAAAILQLMDEKKISIDDPAAKYVPYIPYGAGVTVRHLLSQTSGIPNPIPLKWVHLTDEDSSFDENAALRKLLSENSGLEFEPGKKFAYSNLSYWLLGKIIENASGISYKEYMRNHIFAKLNLPPEEMGFTITPDSNHAKGYLKKFTFLNLFKSFVMDSKYFGEYEDGWLHIENHYLNGPAFGGIVSSAKAISAFLRDVLRSESVLFSAETKMLFLKQQKNNDGKYIEMSLGWHIKTFNNIKYYFKEGGGGGFHCEMRIYPSQNIASVVIANNTSFDAGGFLNDVDKEFFKR
jgi:D-alanyl-D-alanine carboxypeptidase